MYIFVFLFHTNIIEVIYLTNINCSENCIYQKDGKCSFENIGHQKITPNGDCAYYTKTLIKLFPFSKENPL